MKRWMSVLRTPVGLTATVLSIGVLVLAVVAPLLWTDNADAIDTDDILAGPSAQHWAGTDNLGRDIFYRTLVATRLSVELALAATVIAVVVGLLIGTAPYLLGRRPGRVVLAGTNIAVAFPGILLALFFAVIFGVGAKGAVLAIGFAGAPTFGRLTQTLVAGISSRDFVAAAHVAGVPRLRILFRHVLPNVSEPLVVNATIGAGAALLSFAGLSFLGLGVQQPAYDWGRLLFDGIGSIYVNPAAALAPGIAVLVAGLAFNLFGESVAKGLGVGVVGGIPALPPSPEALEADAPAAEQAHAHELILALPNGYDTQLGAFATYLSAGQRQRIGLARALFGRPALVVLDEPNSNLDRVGDEALASAIDGMRRRGQTIVLVSHRVQAITMADLLLYIDRGIQRAFGTRDEVMRLFQGATAGTGAPKPEPAAPATTPPQNGAGA